MVFRSPNDAAIYVCFFFSVAVRLSDFVWLFEGKFYSSIFLELLQQEMIVGSVLFFSFELVFSVWYSFFIASIKICSMKFESEWLPEFFYVLCVNFFE